MAKKHPEIPNDRPSFWQVDPAGNWREDKTWFANSPAGGNYDCLDAPVMMFSKPCPQGGNWQGTGDIDDFTIKKTQTDHD